MGTPPRLSGAAGRGACHHRPPVNTTIRIILLTVAACLLAVAPASAQSDPDAYASCPTAGDAVFVDVSRASCDDARAVAVAIAAAPGVDLQTVIAATGWTPLRVIDQAPLTAYDIYATRGTAALWIRRRGEAPDLDGWMAGRELVFASATIVPGGPAPRGATLCTSAFLIRIGTSLGGLSAGHCAGLTKARRDAAAQRRDAARAAARDPAGPRAPQPPAPPAEDRRARPAGRGRPGARPGERHRPLHLPAAAVRPRAARDRCSDGASATPASRAGRTGAARSSGRFPGVRGLSCTNIIAREGDSGSPVYTAPAADGTVRAVGIANVVVGLFGLMCFEPIDRVLDALDARLVDAG